MLKTVKKIKKQKVELCSLNVENKFWGSPKRWSYIPDHGNLFCSTPYNPYSNIHTLILNLHLYTPHGVLGFWGSRPSLILLLNSTLRSAVHLSSFRKANLTWLIQPNNSLLKGSVTCTRQASMTSTCCWRLLDSTRERQPQLWSNKSR